MAGLNTKTISPNIPVEEITVNYHDVAYKLKPIEALIEATVGAFWNEDAYYAKGSILSGQVLSNVAEVAKSDPRFPLQLAAYARNVLNLRTTPQVLLVEAANIEASKPFVRSYAPKIIKRADELSGVTAYQLSAHGKPIPNSLKKGVADAFAKFDEYQLNKYDSEKGAVKLGDVLRLIDRKTNYPVTRAMYNYLVNDEVDAEALPKIAALKKLLSKDAIDVEAKQLISESAVTWETLISKFGSTAETWELAIPNMGYMALLRNLRNFEEKKVDLTPVLEIIQDTARVKASKQLPFRFYSAYKATSSQKVRRAIAQAFEASVSNVDLPGRTAIIVDLSASMHSPLSKNSSVMYKDVGAVLGAVATKKAEDSVVVGFADVAKRVMLNPDDTMISNVEKILAADVGGSTHAHLAFNEIQGEKFDRVILVSDMQCYGNSSGWTTGVTKEWDAYVRKYPKARLYSIDLHAYGTSQVPSTERNVTKLNGWSDKVLDYIVLSEKRDVMEVEIRKW